MSGVSELARQEEEADQKQDGDLELRSLKNTYVDVVFRASQLRIEKAELQTRLHRVEELIDCADYECGQAIKEIEIYLTRRERK